MNKRIRKKQGKKALTVQKYYFKFFKLEDYSKDKIVFRETIVFAGSCEEFKGLYGEGNKEEKC